MRRGTNRGSGKFRLGTIFIVSFVLLILYVLYTGEQHADPRLDEFLQTPQATQPVTMP
jgi:hypothetical protein